MMVYRKLNALLTVQQRRKAIFLLGLMLIGMALETFGIGMVIPALHLMTEPNFAEKYPNLMPLLVYLGSPTQVQLVIGGMITLVGVYSVKTIFLSFLVWRQAQFVFGLQANLSQRLFTGYLTQPYTFHLQRNSAQLIRNVMTEVAQFTFSATLPCVTLIGEGLVVFGIMFLLLMMEPLGSLIVIMVVSAAGFVFYQITRNPILRWGKARQYHEGQRIQHLQQGLSGAKDVKLLGREADFLTQYSTHNSGTARVTQLQTVIQALPRLGLEWLAMVGLAALVLTMVAQGRSIESLLPIIGLFAAAAFRLMPSATRVISSLQGMRYSLPVINHLDDEIKLLENGPSVKHVRGKPIDALRDSIKLKSVSYRYPNSCNQVLKNVSLGISRGSSVGFVGGSGAGKSTLIDIILGLLTPESGQILVDDIDIQRNLRSWQDQIGYVPQTIYLTDDTLRRNVAFGLSENQINDIAVERAIAAAQLIDFVDGLPDGLNTMVGERGVRLSGGQRQRIGIARALYHDPAVLVLDEATSSLDTATEAGVMQAVNALHGDKTLIVVAHRLSTVEHCDVLCKLENGLMIKTGTYKEVVTT